MTSPLSPDIPETVLADLASGPLAELAPRMEFYKGLEIGRQGSPCDRLYIIAQGQVLVSRRVPAGGECALFVLGPGELFGEGSLRQARRWLVTARALTDGSAHSLPSAHLPRLAQYFPTLISHVICLLANRLEQAHSRVGLATTTGARERLLGLLRVFAGHQGHFKGDWIRIPMHLTQQELGEMIGLARETIARLLTDLTEEGIIRREDRKVLWLRTSIVADV